jgi:hypothetical protein
MELQNEQINELLDKTILLLKQYKELVNQYNEKILKEKYCYYSYLYRILQIENLNLLLNIDLKQIKIIDGNEEYKKILSSVKN